jgi:FlgD Ig-like domain
MSRKFFTLLVGLLISTSAFAADAQIKLKGYSDEDVVRYELMTQRAAPLEVIGIGQPSYLMSLHEGTYSWSMTVPDGSTAELSATTTQEVYFVVDMAGEYTVTLDYTDGEGAASSTSQVITGANYVGVTAGNCALCHAEKHTDWLTTGHASITERDLDGVTSSHIAGYCNSCHATGYDPDSMAVNGGFDDEATAEGWVFPDTLMVGNYQDLVDNYPATAEMANVQCESCHGPGEGHPNGGGAAKLAVSKSGEVCKYCHDSPDHHPQATQWVTSVHGSDVNPDEHFAGSGSCVGCHTAEGFFEQNVEQVELTAPYDVPNGQSCVVCHDPHKQTTDFQLRVAGDYSYLDDETSEPKYSSTGEIDQACTVCHHFRAGRDYPGQVPHHSHQTEMLDNTAGWMNPDKTMPASNAHGTLIEKRCAGCHMAEGEGEKGNIVGGHTFKMHRAMGDTVNTVVLTEDAHLTEACVACHTGIGDDFDINGVQTKVTLMLNELFDRLPKATSGRLAGSPAYDSTSLVDGDISVDQLTAAFNWYIVDYDGSKGVHNPAMSVALLADALDRVPATAECASCDINGDGKLGIADAVKLILMAATDSTQACIDRNGDFVYDINDVIKLIADIWAGSCGGTMLAGVGGVELIHTQVELTADQIQYIESVMEQLELTSEQAAAFQVALFGDGSGMSSLPKAFSLAQNSPNPFNPSTTIKFAVAEGKAGLVTLKLYDVRGRLVRSLVDGTKESGDYTVFWDGTNENGQKVSSGVYFYRMVTGDFMQTRKMVMLK